MAKGTVVIGCKLPHGLILRHPLAKDKTVLLNGTNTSKLVPRPSFVTTQIDGEFWEGWKLMHSSYQPLKSGAIFEAAGQREAEDKGRELEKEKTGFEPMPQKAPGITKAD